MGEYFRSWNRTERLWELSPDSVKHLTRRERGQQLTDRQTEQRLFPYENECRAKRTTEPDTHFSVIMSFSGNNPSQRQNGDALSFQQLQWGFTGGRRKADLFFWMNENGLHCGITCIQMEPPRVSCASVLFNLETVPLLIGGRMGGLAVRPRVWGCYNGRHG